jgi:hypothetical protein
MLSKAKFILSSCNKNYFGLRSLNYRNFSTKDVMKELSLTNEEIKELTNKIKDPWVKPGKEKLVIK